MWEKPWKYKEGIIIGAGLTITGVLLQSTLGRVEWGLMAAPVNYLALALFIGIIILLHLLRRKVWLFTWLGSIHSAAASIGWASVCTVVMGLVRQVPSEAGSAPFPGLSQMVSNWSFVLVYIWMILSLGMTILRVCIPLRLKRLPFLLNHLGLFIALVCAVLGSADLQRLKMTSELGKAEWRAVDDYGHVHELPLAVELKSFDIREYPPKLMMVDNHSGAALPYGAPANILLEEEVTCAELNGWSVSLLELLENAAPVISEDTVRYTEFHSSGACAAALICASKPGCPPVTDWVSCGSYAFPYKALKVNDEISIIMPEREPQRYVSAVNIYTKSGKSLSDTIQVNKPFRIEGWKIYQLDYDHSKGRWSEMSVFEVVRDPWMPAVYVGIWMLIAGAVCMFVQFGRKKEVRK